MSSRAAASANSDIACVLKLEFEFRRDAFTLRARCELHAPVTGICGPSGAGKSTLLAQVAGLLKPARGTIMFEGETLFDADAGIFVPAHRRHFGLVFQDGQLFPHLSEIEEHTSELQSLMRISYAVFCLKKNTNN